MHSPSSEGMYQRQPFRKGLVLGATVPDLADWWERAYGVRTATLVETAQRLTFDADGPYQGTGTPNSLGHKFIAELVEAFPGQVDAISIHKPTLEDVFIHRTGRRFEEAQA